MWVRAARQDPFDDDREDNKNLRVISLNIEGCTETQIEEIIKRFKPDVLCLQESRLNSGELAEKKYKIKKHTLVGTSGDIYSESRLNYVERTGLATLITNNLTKNMIQIKGKNQYMNTNLLELDSENAIIIANCYFPTLGGKKNYQKQFEEATKELIRQVRETRDTKGKKYKSIKALAMGDFNFCIHSHSRYKKRTEQMKDMIYELDGTYHIPDMPTHKSRAHKKWSYLDGLIVSSGIKISKMQVLDQEDFPQGDSDHLPLMVDLDINAAIPECKGDTDEVDNSWPYNQ